MHLWHVDSARQGNRNDCSIVCIYGSALPAVSWRWYRMGDGRLYCQKAGEGWMLMRRRRKKKHPVRKFLRNLLAVLLCIFVVACDFFGVKGYQMYKEAVTEKPISERVEVSDIFPSLFCCYSYSGFIMWEGDIRGLRTYFEVGSQ